jgi:hypothetical protein
VREGRASWWPRLIAIDTSFFNSPNRAALAHGGFDEADRWSGNPRGDSERGMAWRAADSLAVRTLVGLDLGTAAPTTRRFRARGG